MSTDLHRVIVKCSTDLDKPHHPSSQPPFPALFNYLRKIPTEGRVMREGKSEWAWCDDLIHCLLQHQTSTADFNKFHVSLCEQSKNLSDFRSAIHASPSLSLALVHDTMTQLINYEQTIERLDSLGQKVTPIYLRRVPCQRNHQPIRALVDFRIGPQLTKVVRKGDLGVLLDNLDPASWKVLLEGNRKVEAPSIIFTILPPDPLLLQHTSRLKKKVLTLWKEALFNVMNALREGRTYKDEKVLVEEAVQDMQFYVAKYEEKINSHINIISFLINNNINNNSFNHKNNKNNKENYKKDHKFIYRSSAYIHSWNSNNNDNKNNRNENNNNNNNKNEKKQFLMISEIGNKSTEATTKATATTATTTLKGEIARVYDEVVKKEDVETQFTSQVIKETQKFFIKGVIEPRSGREISSDEAIRRGIISLKQGLYKSERGDISINEAMEEGLIMVESSNRSIEMGQLVRSGIVRTVSSKEVVSYMVLSIEDPESHERLGVKEAIKRGVLDEEGGRYVINKESGKSLSIQSAIDQGYLKVYEVKRQPIEIKENHDVTVESLGVDSEEQEGRKEERENEKNKDEDDDDDDDEYYVIFEVISKMSDNTYFFDPTNGNRRLLKEAVVSGGVSLNPLRLVLSDGTGLSLQEGLLEGVVSVRGVAELLGALEERSLGSVLNKKVLTVERDQLVCKDKNNNLDLKEAAKQKIIIPANLYFWDAQTKCVTSLKAALMNDRMRRDGAVYDWSSNAWVVFQEAVDCGLIDVDVDRNGLLERYAGYMTMKDVVDEDFVTRDRPNKLNQAHQHNSLDDNCLSFGDAIMDGKFEVKNLSLKGGTRGGKKEMTLVEGEKRGLLEEGLVSKVIDVVTENDLKRMVDKQLIDMEKGRVRSSEKEKWVRMEDASRQGVIDLGGIFVVDLGDGKVKSLGGLRDEEKLDTKGGCMVVKGKRITLPDAIKQNHLKITVDSKDFYDPPHNHVSHDRFSPTNNHSLSSSHRPPTQLDNGDLFYDTPSTPNSGLVNGASHFDVSKNRHNNLNQSFDQLDGNIENDLMNFEQSLPLKSNYNNNAYHKNNSGNNISYNPSNNSNSNNNKTNNNTTNNNNISNNNNETFHNPLFNHANGVSKHHNSTTFEQSSKFDSKATFNSKNNPSNESIANDFNHNSSYDSLDTASSGIDSYHDRPHKNDLERKPLVSEEEVKYRENKSKMDGLMERKTKCDERRMKVEKKIDDSGYDLDEVLKDLEALKDDFKQQKNDSEKLNEEIKNPKVNDGEQQQQLQTLQKKLDGQLLDNLADLNALITTVSAAKTQDDQVKNELELLWKQLDPLNNLLERHAGDSYGGSENELKEEMEELKEVSQHLQDVMEQRTGAKEMIDNLEENFNKLGNRKHHYRLPSEKYLAAQKKIVDKKIETLSKVILKKTTPPARNNISTIASKAPPKDVESTDQAATVKEFNDVHARLSGWMKEAIDRICKKDGNDALESSVRRICQDRELKFQRDYHNLKQLSAALPREAGKMEKVSEDWNKLSVLIDQLISFLVLSQLDRWEKYLENADEQLLNTCDITRVEQQLTSHNNQHEDLMNKRPVMKADVSKCSDMMNLMTSLGGGDFEEEDNNEDGADKDIQNLQMRFAGVSNKFNIIIQESRNKQVCLEDVAEMASYLKHVSSQLFSWFNRKQQSVAAMEKIPQNDLAAVCDGIHQGEETERGLITRSSLVEECVRLSTEMKDLCSEASGTIIENQVSGLKTEFESLNVSNQKALSHLLFILQQSQQDLKTMLNDTNDRLQHCKHCLTRIEQPLFNPPSLDTFSRNLQKVESQVKDMEGDLERNEFVFDGQQGQEEQQAYMQGLQEEIEGMNRQLQRRKDEADKFEYAMTSFYKHYEAMMGGLQGVEDNLMSQDGVSVESAVVVNQQIQELKMMREDLEVAKGMRSKCQDATSDLKASRDPEAVAEVDKMINNFGTVLLNVERGMEEREWLLEVALKQTKSYAKHLKAVAEWLPLCEDGLDEIEVGILEGGVKNVSKAKLLSLKKIVLNGFNDLGVLESVAFLGRRLELQANDVLAGEVAELMERVDVILDKINQLLLLESKNSGKGDSEHDGDHLGMLEKEIEDINNTENYSKSELTNIKLLAKEVTKLSSTNIISDRRRLQDLKRKMTDKRMKSKEKERRWTEWNEGVIEMMEWMNEFRNILNYSKIMSSNPEAFFNQTKFFQKNSEEFEAKRKECEKLMGRTPVEASSSESSSGAKVEKEESGRADYVDLQKKLLKGLMGDNSAMIREIQNSLKNHTARLDSLTHRSTDHNTHMRNITNTLQQLHQPPLQANYRDTLFVLEKELDLERDSLEKIKREAALVRWTGRKGDMLEVGSGVREKVYAWVDAWEEMKRMQGNADLAEEEANILQMTDDADLLLTSLNDFEDFLLADHNEPKDFRSLQSHLESKEEDLNHLISLLRQLKQETSNQDSPYGKADDRGDGGDGRFAHLSERLKELMKKYRGLHSHLLKKRGQYDEDLMLSGRSEEVVELRFDWLEKIHAYLKENDALLGDVDTVAMLIEQYQNFQEELSQHDKIMEKIAQSIPDHDSIPRLQELTEKVHALNGLRGERLNEAKSLALEYQSMVEQLRERLPPIETKLNETLEGSVVNDEENRLKSQLNTLELLKNRLERETNLVEQTGFCHDEIMGNVNPSAIKFIQYYNTITVTRWEHAMLRCQDYINNCKNQLSHVKGQEGVIDNLWAWINENNQLITMKNEDTLPRDLTTVDLLIKEHEEFHEELMQKNSELDDLSNNASIPPQERQGLENGWRGLWRLSVERKKLLQELLEQLLELEKFQNFSLEEWKQRYVAWIKSNKRRLMDFFRRHDKKGYGFLTRKQFVDGMMSSGFETTRRELDTVFDSYENNGELHYMPFIDSLKGSSSFISRSSSPASSDATERWRRIDDEVLRKVSSCQCRKQYAAYKMEEGKYMFGEKGRQYLLRFVNGVVMVRVGGGWQSLGEFMLYNDPCKAKNRTNVVLRNLDFSGNLSRAGSTTSLKSPSHIPPTPTSAMTTGSLKRVKKKAGTTHSMSNLHSNSVTDISFSSDALTTPRTGKGVKKFMAPKRLISQHKSTSDLKPFRNH